jgi:hypothetical protein
MTAKNRVDGNLQYQPEQGAAANDWLTSWIATHEGDLRSHAGNGHSLAAIEPAHEEGCVTQLDVEYHFETADQAAFDVLFEELTAAIYAGTAAPFAAADCDSGWGQSQESPGGARPAEAGPQ